MVRILKPDPSPGSKNGWKTQEIHDFQHIPGIKLRWCPPWNQPGVNTNPRLVPQKVCHWEDRMVGVKGPELDQSAPSGLRLLTAQARTKWASRCAPFRSVVLLARRAHFLAHVHCFMWQAWAIRERWFWTVRSLCMICTGPHEKILWRSCWHPLCTSLHDLAQVVLATRFLHCLAQVLSEDLVEIP